MQMDPYNMPMVQRVEIGMPPMPGMGLGQRMGIGMPGGLTPMPGVGMGMGMGTGMEMGQQGAEIRAGMDVGQGGTGMAAGMVTGESPLPYSPEVPFFQVLPGDLKAGKDETTVAFGMPSSMIDVLLRTREKDEIEAATGTKIMIGEEGDYLPGTSDRVVKIVGPAPGVLQAEQIISQRVARALSY
ncbi:unnamed protein product [Chrysoparadoxa australica]